MCAKSVTLNVVPAPLLVSSWTHTVVFCCYSGGLQTFASTRVPSSGNSSFKGRWIGAFVGDFVEWKCILIISSRHSQALGQWIRGKRFIKSPLWRGVALNLFTTNLIQVRRPPPSRLYCRSAVVVPKEETSLNKLQIALRNGHKWFITLLQAIQRQTQERSTRWS